MAARPVWKGHLRISLVSIAVEMYSATKSGGRVSFRQIHEPSGKPIRYEKVAQGIGPVSSDEIAKGYETEPGTFVLLSPDEVDAVKLETKKTLELIQFVGGCEIPPLYFDKPYYLVPADELSEDAYRVVRDALRQAEKIGLGQVTLRGREYLAAVRPCGDGLLLETLHYEEEIRRSDPMFAAIPGEKADGDMLDVATTLIARKTAPFDASAFRDNYEHALRELVERKAKSRKAKTVQAEDHPARETGGDNVVDLMSALKQSLEKTKPEKAAKPAKKPATKRTRKRA